MKKMVAKVLTRKETEKVRRLHRDRIVSSTNVITPKGDEFKNRWTLRGYEHPDLAEAVQKRVISAPTLSVLAKRLILQIVASSKWALNLADSKEAFLSAEKDESPTVCTEQPEGGVPGVVRGLPIEFLHPVYGQSHAPDSWYTTLDKNLVQIGFEKSRFDACLCHVRNDATKVLEGVIGVQVEDLPGGGAGKKHIRCMRELRQRFDSVEGELTGCHFHQEADWAIRGSQKEFAQNIHPVAIPRDMKDERELTPYLTRQMRGWLGARGWFATQSRVALAAQVSLGMQSFPAPKISDLKKCNQISRGAS